MSAFSTLEDFRVIGRCDHKLLDIVVISICAVISGANTWVDIHDFGVAKQAWFSKFLELPNGIPSHDTIGRIFSMLDPVKFEICFMNWIQTVFEVTQGQIVPVDGKTLRQSYDRKSEKAAIHMVSAWASRNGIVLGQIKTDEKSNEITAIPELLNLLDITGCVITIDAMGCQKAIAENIVNNSADYVIAIKENQPTLYNEIVEHIDDALAQGAKAKTILDFHETINEDHGRKEVRRYYISEDIDSIDSAVDWKGLNSIGMVESIRTVNGKTTITRRYHIASIEKNAKNYAAANRAHWSVENSLHWNLDVSFREDESRVRKDHAPNNFSVLRRIALNYLKNERTVKRGIEGKRNKAGWDINYLEKVVGF